MSEDSEYRVSKNGGEYLFRDRDEAARTPLTSPIRLFMMPSDDEGDRVLLGSTTFESLASIGLEEVTRKIMQTFAKRYGLDETPDEMRFVWASASSPLWDAPNTE